MTDRYKLVGHEAVPCASLTEWAREFEKTKPVALDKIGKVRVSTVFLGLDHSFGRGEPLLFETMIFGGKHDEYQERYTTWTEAEAGHAKALALVKS